MTACTPKTLQGHYNITCRMLYVERSEAFAPLIIFILVVWNFSICLIEPIRLLGCTSVPVPMYQCISISTMYQRNVPGIWPTRSTRLPGPTYQAQPGPTRTYQNPALPGLGLPKDHTLDHILFWQPPKNTSKTTYFFWHTFEKAKTYILHCKMYVFLEIAKNWQKMHQNLAFQQLTFQKHTFYSVKCMFLTLGLKFQAWNLEISFQNWEKHTFYSVKCMFLTLVLKFQVWNLEISFQNWKNIHFTM